MPDDRPLFTTLLPGQTSRKDTKVTQQTITCLISTIETLEASNTQHDCKLNR